MKIDYSGMTVNERLFVSGKLDIFESYVKKKQLEKVKELLRELDVDEKSIQDIILNLR